jgi:hypothetical protein
MERRLTKKCDEHLTDFKDGIKSWFDKNKSEVCGDCNTSEFLNFIYDYDAISITKEDFLKRKRVKSLVPQYERCTANRANGDQCTRRKQAGLDFCGTHHKGTPHGIVSTKTPENTQYSKIEVFLKEIKGINYYLDGTSNVYKAEDILSNKIDPAVIAHYKVESGIYTIPEFNI